MPPKRAAPPPIDTETNTGGTLMSAPPPPTIPSSRRRSTNHSHSTGTPSASAPPSLFFALPLPPPYNPAPSSPDADAENVPPSDSQFVAFLHSIIATLPAPTQALYDSAIRNLAPENTQDLTDEMRASLTSALTAFVTHLPTVDWERDGTEGRFLPRLARGEVSGRELVLWADTITAALRAFSGVGGSPAPSWASSPGSARSPIPTQIPNPATPTRTPAIDFAYIPRSNPQGRSATVRASTLTRDANACVLTSLVGPSLEVAHIIPFSVRGAKWDAFWGFWSLFLGAQGAERVRRATLQLSNGEVPEEQRQAGAVGELANCLTLASHVHRHFDAGEIEILPVPGSGNWSGDYDPSLASSYDVRLSFPGQALTPFSRYVYSAGAPPQLLSMTQIAPGDVITLATPDPAQWPLPHPLLLQLHALCGRVKRLRAAAGWPVLPYGDGSEDGVTWGEEEVEVWDEWDEDEEERIKVRWEGRCEGLAGSLDRDAAQVEPESDMGGRGKKRELDAVVGEEREKGAGGNEILERPRKVEVVMGEMGMREEERRRLMKQRERGGCGGFY